MVNKCLVEVPMVCATCARDEWMECAHRCHRMECVVADDYTCGHWAPFYVYPTPDDPQVFGAMRGEGQ